MGSEGPSTKTKLGLPFSKLLYKETGDGVKSVGIAEPCIPSSVAIRSLFSTQAGERALATGKRFLAHFEHAYIDFIDLYKLYVSMSIRAKAHRRGQASVAGRARPLQPNRRHCWLLRLETLVENLMSVINP